MNKAVLISVRPEECARIICGKETVKVFKTRPKLQLPFKCYIYCAKANERIVDVLQDGNENCGEIYLREPVTVACICRWIDRILPSPEPYGIYDVSDDYVLQTCLDNGALWDYGKGAVLYGWHLSDLRIYATPRELSEFGVNRPFQSWGYVYE